METEMNKDKTNKSKVANMEEDISYDWKNLKELEKKNARLKGYFSFEK